MADVSKFDKLVSLAKRRGFVFLSSEIYGGLGSVYDYGPLGAELLKNIRTAWWRHFIHQRPNVVGLESQIFMHPKVWEASGHVGGFHDPLVDCKSCKNRFRADHVLEDAFDDIDGDEYTNDQLTGLMAEREVVCPVCGERDWTDVRDFNLMFKSQRGSVSNESEDNVLYLRPETAQGMFVQFQNVLQSSRQKVPFGIAQIGKAFRNEITKGKFVFRTLEFEQMELQYFIREESWEEEFESWRKAISGWYSDVLGIPVDAFRWKPHHPDKLAHYAKKAEDYEYQFSTGFGEVSGLHYRTDFDLSTHQEHSGQRLAVQDQETNEWYVPHVIESTFGVNRNLMLLLDHAYTEEEDRVVLKLPKDLAPYRVAVSPLLRNKPELVAKAQEVFAMLSKDFVCAWDDRGNIGKRYLSQDEIGTPYFVTIDFQTLEDDTVTIRDRDTKEQERVGVDEVVSLLG